MMIYIAVLALTGCTGNGGDAKTVAQPADTVYTERAALDVYDYDPVRALLDRKSVV